jgi:hypothetical protein
LQNEGESVKDFFQTEEIFYLPSTTKILMILIQINLLPKWEQSVLWIYWQIDLDDVTCITAIMLTTMHLKKEAKKDYKLLNLP